MHSVLFQHHFVKRFNSLWNNILLGKIEFTELSISVHSHRQVDFSVHAGCSMRLVQCDSGKEAADRHTKVQKGTAGGLVLVNLDMGGEMEQCQHSLERA